MSGAALLSRIACTMLLWLVLLVLLGGVIYERRFEIGYEPEHSPERTAHRDSVALARARTGLARDGGDWPLARLLLSDFE